jgi:signal transduction histidine kinase
VIERQVGQLVRLVDDLLDVSRITANKIRCVVNRTSSRVLMTTAVESILPLAAAADQTLDVGLPPTPSSGWRATGRGWSRSSRTSSTTR